MPLYAIIMHFYDMQYSFKIFHYLANNLSCFPSVVMSSVMVILPSQRNGVKEKKIWNYYSSITKEKDDKEVEYGMSHVLGKGKQM